MSRTIAFEFSTAPLVVFGPGTIDRIGAHAARFGRRAWLVTGAASLEREGVLERIARSLAASGVHFERQRIEGEPDTATVDAGARAARGAGCDVVVGVGGGSTLDAAKAVACLMANEGEALDYLEVVGRGRKIERAPVPFVAAPTTAGTGSEVTRNAVLADAGTGTKASLRDERLLARVALLDPTLTHSAPAAVTARCGLDALIQLIEPYVSKRANAMIDPLAIEGIRRIGAALPRAWVDGADAAARADVMLAAMWSGMALAHCGLGACHALAGPLGGSFPIPHGFACAATMPAVMRANLEVAERSGAEATVQRYAEVALALGIPQRANALETARAGAERVGELVRRLEAPRLSAFGVTRESFDDLAQRARRTSSMKANPVDLGDDDLRRILEESL